MIGYLRGVVVALDEDGATILLGSHVGVDVVMPAAQARALQLDQHVRLWVHTVVRDQGWELFAFADRPARDLFRVLQRVPQVGARTALAMLSMYSPAVLVRAVLDEDVDALSLVPRIGAKTAKRIIVELKDRLERTGFVAANASSRADQGAEADAIQGLIKLGYTPNDARRRIHAVRDEMAEPPSIEALIQAVLTTEHR